MLIKRIQVCTNGISMRESVLEAATIPHEVRNVAVLELAGPNLNCPMELWVLGDEDYESALRLLHQTRAEGNGEPAAGENAE